MLEFLIDKMQDTRFLAALFAAVAAVATVVTLAMPLLVTDTLDKRMPPYDWGFNGCSKLLSD